ncbi:MAG: parE, partial [Rickettsiaceae bacterium]|nr:parE [Rickettsiaceae bacterium]
MFYSKNHVINFKRFILLVGDMPDLFAEQPSVGKSKDVKKDVNKDGSEYTASDIEVLEGLEPVRRRPGMYIGGTDENAMHHLVSEVFDNSMDEAVAGFASYIEVELHADGSITVADNGRGIPVDKHPKYPGKSALEVILTTLHSGGKFSNKVYYTSGGLHGVGISVVNALSENFVVQVKRDGKIYEQRYSRGEPKDKLKVIGELKKKESGTKVTFYPDMEIFDDNIRFRPARLYAQAKSKAYLFKGVEIRWKCAPALLAHSKSKAPEEEVIKFPNGIADYLAESTAEEDKV